MSMYWKRTSTKVYTVVGILFLLMALFLLGLWLAKEPSASQKAKVIPSTVPGMVIGHVYTPAGKPVQGATVTALIWGQRVDNSLSKTTTNASGYFELSPDGLTDGVELVAESDQGLTTSVQSPRLDQPVEIYLQALSAILDLSFVDSDGTAVPNVEVIAKSNRQSRGKAPTGQNLNGTTDAQGKVRFRGLVLGDEITFDVPDTRFAKLPTLVSVILLTQRLTEIKAIELARPSSISGRVTLPDGTPVQVTVTYKDDLSPLQWVFSNNNGEYRIDRLARGHYDISVLQDSAPSPWVFAEKVGVPLHSNQDLTGQNLVLAQGATILGTVTEQGTNRTPDFAISTAGGRGPSGGMASAYTGPSKLAAQQSISADGKFALLVPGGKYTVEYSPPRGFELVDLSKHDLTLEENHTYHMNVEVRRAPTLPTGKNITGRVLNEANQPVEATIWSDVVVRATQSDGTFELPNLTGTHELRAVMKGTLDTVTPVAVEVNAGGEVTLHVKKGASAAFKGRVLDENGNPMSGVVMSLMYESGTSFAGRNGGAHITDENGNYSCPDIFADIRHLLQMRAQGYAGPRFTLEASKSGVVQKIPDIVMWKRNGVFGGRVINEAGKPVTDVKVSTEEFSQLTFSAMTDADGQFRIDYIADPNFNVTVPGYTLLSPNPPFKKGSRDNVLIIRPQN